MDVSPLTLIGDERITADPRSCDPASLVWGNALLGVNCPAIGVTLVKEPSHPALLVRIPSVSVSVFANRYDSTSVYMLLKNVDEALLSFVRVIEARCKDYVDAHPTYLQPKAGRRVEFFSIISSDGTAMKVKTHFPFVAINAATGRLIRHTELCGAREATDVTLRFGGLWKTCISAGMHLHLVGGTFSFA